MTQYTRAPTNPCCSALDAFRLDKTLYQGPLGYTKTNSLYEAPFRIHDGHLQDLPPDQPGMMQPQRNQACPGYPFKVEGELPRGRSDGCMGNPPPQIQWWKFGTGYRKPGT